MANSHKHIFHGRGIRLAPYKSFGDVMKSMPTSFPRTHEEICNFYLEVHRAAYPSECVCEYEVTLMNLVEELFTLQSGSLGRYRVGDLDKWAVTELAYFAATQVMGDTMYIPHFIHAGLCLYVSGIFGDHSNVTNNARKMLNEVENASLILEPVEIIHGDEDSCGDTKLNGTNGTATTVSNSLYHHDQRMKVCTKAAIHH